MHIIDANTQLTLFTRHTSEEMARGSQRKLVRRLRRQRRQERRQERAAARASRPTAGVQEGRDAVIGQAELAEDSAQVRLDRAS